MLTNNARICPRCNGSKIYHSLGTVTAIENARPCYACDGAGAFPPANDENTIAAIRALIVNPKTGSTYSTSLHSKAGRKRAAGVNALTRRRAQYVWRMARWHSGADGNGANLGGAIMADMDLGHDPWKPELDAFADVIALECHGSHMRAARRWSQALYGG